MEAHAERIAILNELDTLKIPYQYYEHDPAYTMEDCAAFDRKAGMEQDVAHCKNLFLTNRQKTEFYLLVLAGDKPYRTGDFCRALSVSRLSFGPPEALEALLRVHPAPSTRFPCSLTGSTVCSSSVTPPCVLLRRCCSTPAKTPLPSSSLLRIFLKVFCLRWVSCR